MQDGRREREWLGRSAGNNMEFVRVASAASVRNGFLDNRLVRGDIPKVGLQ